MGDCNCGKGHSEARTVLGCGCGDRNPFDCCKRASGVVKNVNAFCVPACGSRVRIYFDQVTDIPVGAFLWAAGVGFLKIVGFNALTCEIELENDCTLGCLGQAVPGTVVASLTLFVITAPSCGTDQSVNDFPYLASGFTAPISGACVGISVTTAVGLAAGNEIIILGGTYRISAVTSETAITICNDGQGLTPGTVVDYKNGAGEFIVPLTLVTTNPCLSTPVTSGKIIVCDGQVLKPLEGSESGQVLIYDAVTGKFNARTVGLSALTCTQLSASLTLDPAQPHGTTYIVNVLSNAGFSIGETVQILGTLFSISDIIGGTQFRLLPSSDPNAIEVYPAGTAICTTDCCTTLSSNVYTNKTGTAAQWLGAEASQSTMVDPPVGTLTLSGANQNITGTTRTHTVINGSSLYTMLCSLTFEWRVTFTLNGTVGQWAHITLAGFQDSAVSPATPTPYQSDSFSETYGMVVAAGSEIHTQKVVVCRVTTIPPSGTLNIAAYAKLTWDGASNATSAVIGLQALSTWVTAAGIACK